MSGVKGRSGRKARKIVARELGGALPPDGFLRLPQITGEGGAIFDRFFQRLGGTIKGSDEIAFNMLVTAVIQWLDAYRQLLAAGGETYVDSNGVTRVSALSRLERDLYQRVVVMLREFGLTPASRVTVQRLAEEEPKKITGVVVEDLPPVGELE